MASPKISDNTIQSELCEIKKRLKKIEDQQEEFKKRLDEKLDESQYRQELRDVVRHFDSDVVG